MRVLYDQIKKFLMISKMMQKIISKSEYATSSNIGN